MIIKTKSYYSRRLGSLTPHKLFRILAVITLLCVWVGTGDGVSASVRSDGSGSFEAHPQPEHTPTHKQQLTLVASIRCSTGSYTVTTAEPHIHHLEWDTNAAW